IDVYPLSFREYLSFKDITINSKLDLVNNKILLNREFELFLKEGGFPKLVEYAPLDKKELLTTYKDSILLKDIVARYKLKEFAKLEEIAAFLLSNSGIAQSITKLKNNFGVSYDTADSYVEYLAKAYMLFEINKFDYSLKKQYSNEKKFYSIDLGLSNIFRVANLQTRGNDLETVVLLELKRRGYNIFYYKTTNNWECDFIVEKNNEIVELIQVTTSLNDEATKKRELRVFSKTIDDLNLNDVKCTVICEDASSIVNYDDLEINIVNIKNWLLSY
ncbi:MAG: DUF4143 domain-containing protein, partial [Sulfurimonas sp.]|nr:DUF4143 domain-containing protein [Sulfurimonas sp.]